MYMEYNNILDEYGNSTCLGLENGRCGLALLTFLLSEKDEKYKEKALEHLAYLMEHVYESSSLSFKEGLLGIGWTIEFLTQNRYISDYNDVLLLEIDDIIYKWVNFHKLSSFALNDGYIGVLLYLCYRLKGNRIIIPNRELALKECTVRVLGKLYMEARKQTEARFSELEWRQLHLLAGLFRRMRIHKRLGDDVLAETQKMVKRFPLQWNFPQKSSLISMLCFLFARSKRNSVVRNFFLM